MPVGVKAMCALRRFHFFLVALFAAVTLPLALAQKEQRQPLTETQIDQIREAGIYPDDRIKLYTKFLDEHVDTIKGLSSRGHSSARTKRVDNELQDLTALMDELGSNLDQYGERKADLRKSLKSLTEATPRWMSVLDALPSEPGFEVSRKEAIDSGKDLSDQAAELFKEQNDYFNAHKDEKGQDRAEPK
jgi:hypothetical protein